MFEIREFVIPGGRRGFLVVSSEGEYAADFRELYPDAGEPPTQFKRLELGEELNRALQRLLDRIPGVDSIAAKRIVRKIFAEIAQRVRSDSENESEHPL